ncbi:hypothetical protein N8805_00955 [Candidatus Pelagibacter ubique]|nr:hypothetical protein [Candidatus Pelagibacter ubique]
MKKLLSILFLGLLLASCSDAKTEKMLETCADENFERWNDNAAILTVDLKAKLLNTNYYTEHARCEVNLKNHPKTFKTTWDR